MGKIAQPQQVNSNSSVSVDPVSQISPDDTISLEMPGEESEIDFSDSDMSLTNEAIRLMDLKHFLEVDITSRDHDKEIKGILEWAKQSGIKNKNHLLSELRQVDYKLGVSDKSKIRKIYEYVVIDSQIKGLVNKQRALTNG